MLIGGVLIRGFRNNQDINWWGIHLTNWWGIHLTNDIPKQSQIGGY